MSLLRIDEIFNFEKGVLQSSKCVPGEYDFITASSDWKTHNEYTHDCEALIFAAAASGSLGRTHYVNGKFVSSDLCFIITPKDQENLPVDLKFYHILFNELKDEIVRNTKAGTSKEAIGLGSFGKYELPYFDIDTQIEIKNQFVNSEDIKSSLTTELNQQVGLVKKLRQQFLQDAVQGKLVEQNKKDEPASELLKKIKAEKVKLIAEKKLKKEKELPPIKPGEIPFEIPGNWVWCRLGEMVNIKSGKRIHAADYRPSGVPFLRSGEIGSLGRGESLKTELYISESKFQDVKQKFGIPKAGDILIACIGGSIGNTWIVDEREFYYKDGNLVLIETIPFLNKDFLLSYLKSPFFWKNTILNATDSSYNALTIVKLNDAEFPLPPLAEQNRIVQKLDELMQYCNELEASIKQSESQNEKLLQQVLREALRRDEVEVERQVAIKSSKGKVIQLKPTNIDYYRRTVLAAEIVWQLHKEPTLGHLKLQKIIYLCQKSANMQLHTNFLRQAMGPYDNRLMRSIDKQLSEKNWFEYKKEQVFKYQPLEKAGQHHNDFLKYFSDESESIQFIINKFKTSKSEIVEIVATLYACMESMLEEKVIFSEQLLLKRFYEWSEEKKKYSEKEVIRVFSRMKQTGILPKGCSF